MSIYEASASLRAPGGLTGALRMFAVEATAFADAMRHPSRVVEDVQQWRRLCLEAERLSATDPQAAAALRRQAARIELG